MEYKLSLAAAWTAVGTALFSLLGMGVLLRRTRRLVEDIAEDLAPGTGVSVAETQPIEASVRHAQATIAKLAETLQKEEKVA